MTAGAVWIVALLGVVSGLLARAVEPALPGVWVGMGHVITSVKLASALASQLFAVGAAAMVLVLVVATVRSTLPAYLRSFSVGAGILVVLAVMIASATRLPHVSRLVLACCAALLSLLKVRMSARLYTLRAASLLTAAMAMAGTVRVLAIALTGFGSSSGSEPMIMAARGLATLVWMLEAAGIAVALGWLVLPQDGKGRAARSVALALVLAVAVALVYVAQLGLDLEASGFVLLIGRAVRKLLLAPPPFVPDVVRAFVEVTAWLAALAILALRPRGILLSAAVALSLVARATLEVPACAIALVIASLALVHHPGPDLRREIELLDGQRRKLAARGDDRASPPAPL